MLEFFLRGMCCGYHNNLILSFPTFALTRQPHMFMFDIKCQTLICVHRVIVITWHHYLLPIPLPLCLFLFTEIEYMLFFTGQQETEQCLLPLVLLCAALTCAGTTMPAKIAGCSGDGRRRDFLERLALRRLA